MFHSKQTFFILDNQLPFSLSIERRVISISGYVAIVLVFVLMIVSVQLYFNWQKLSELTPLAIFDFKKNDWFDAKVNIVNNFKRPYAIPNDELIYEITYTNKKSETIKLQPNLYVLVGGETKFMNEMLGPLTLDAGKSEPQRYILHPKNIGENQIRLVVKILNVTHIGLPLDEVAITYNLEVHDELNKLQDESNEINQQALVISTSVALATVGSLIVNIWFSNKQVKSLERQTEILRQTNEKRPWIGRENRFDNIVLQPRDPFNPPMIRIHFYNYGSSPAFNIVNRSYSDTNIPPPNAFELAPPHPPFALTPNERFTHRIHISDAEHAQALTGILHYGIQIRYTGQNGVEGLYELRGHWDHGNDTFDGIDVR